MIIGVLGGGQLGRMLALAGANLGMRFRFMDPSSEAPAGRVGELVVDDFARPRRLSEFARGLSLVTYEFENVPVDLVRRLSRSLPVEPGPEALEQAQDRVLEKLLFRRLGIPTARFAPINGPGDVEAAVREAGLPGVLKTRRMGYDGKGQALVKSAAELRRAIDLLGRKELILEQFVDFDREASIVAVRGRDGKAAFYPITENVHQRGILWQSRTPARDCQSLQKRAESYARRVMQQTGYVGVLAIEFFVHQGRLLANEMAPRVHNSGHWTIDGAPCSQFENHLRAIAGLPLGPTESSGYCGMVNLIGAEPPLEKLAAIRGARVHLYDKAPRPGRKVGHVNIVSSTAPERERAMRAVAALARLSSPLRTARAGRCRPGTA